jgi:hypothetical protein
LWSILIPTKNKFSPPENNLWQQVLFTNCLENFNQGWEETVNMGLCQLLRTTLAKKPQDKLVGLPSFEILSDSDKLKKYFKLVINRWTKNK